MTIVGSVLENMDMERLIGGTSTFLHPDTRSADHLNLEIGREVAERITEKGQSMQSVEEVAL